MRKLSELQDELFSELAKRPNLDGFFRPMLENRVREYGWLENTLVQIVLTRREVEALEKLIETAKQMGGSLLKDVAGGLKGSEPGFDAQLVDVLAELNAVLWLKKERYSDITKLQRGRGKTPDFSATKEEKEHLFEVKNLRTPHDVLDVLFTRLTSQSLLNPAYYNKIFTIRYTGNQQLVETVDTSDRLNVVRFGELLDDSLRSGKQKLTYSYRKRDEGRRVDSKLECSWRESDTFNVHWTSSGYTISSEEPRSAQILVPLLRKTWNHVCHAIIQLTEYDREGARDKWVLLNWHKPGAFLLNPTVASQYQESVTLMNEVVATIDPRLHVQLLGG